MEEKPTAVTTTLCLPRPLAGAVAVMARRPRRTPRGSGEATPAGPRHPMPPLHQTRGGSRRRHPGWPTPSAAQRERGGKGREGEATQRERGGKWKGSKE